MEPTIICPSCKAEIRLTDSLAAPLVEETRQEYEKRLAQKDIDMARRESTLRERELALDQAKTSMDEEVAGKLKEERAKIVAEEARKARQVLAADIDEKADEIKTLQAVLKERNSKLEEAQKTQVDLLRKQREIDDAKRELDLTIEKRVQEGLSKTRDQARKEVEEELRLKLLEREQTITSMQNKIEELKRRAEQGSQQLQGEVQEIELEALLSAQFSHDTIEPVPKGEHGGDILHRVLGPAGQMCGTIIWESKRTKNWSDGWLSKLRKDQQTAKAEIAIVISQALPKEVEGFDLIENVWVAHPRFTVPLATVLRQSLIELATARKATEGQHTKMGMVYHYLTGPRFRQRVQGIVEAFSSMQDDLNKERRAIQKQWAKREEQLSRVMVATAGMYGDLHGIVGRTLQEIDGLNLKALEIADDLAGEAAGK
jgi:hypothetical protein